MRKTFRNLDEDSRRVLLILIAIALTSTIISIIARVLDSQLALGWFDGLDFLVD
jgi:hypothetical protein